MQKSKSSPAGVMLSPIKGRAPDVKAMAKPLPWEVKRQEEAEKAKAKRGKGLQRKKKLGPIGLEDSRSNDKVAIPFHQRRPACQEGWLVILGLFSAGSSGPVAIESGRKLRALRMRQDLAAAFLQRVWRGWCG